MTQQFSVAERVDRGASMLSLVKPGWHRDVHLPLLDIEDYESCILGQVYGNYFRVVNTWGMDFDTAHDFGFQTHSKLDTWRINRAWRAKLVELQREDAPAQIQGWSTTYSILDEVTDFVTADEAAPRQLAGV